MNAHDPNDAFDGRVRAVHAQSLEQLSPRVQAQLAQRRRAAMQGTAPRPGRGLLPWAGVATAGLALALVVQLRPPSAPVQRGDATARSASTTQTARSLATAPAPRIASLDSAPSAADVDAIGTDLSEDPDFYLWLGDERPARTE